MMTQKSDALSVDHNTQKDQLDLDFDDGLS